MGLELLLNSLGIGVCVLEPQTGVCLYQNEDCRNILAQPDAAWLRAVLCSSSCSHAPESTPACCVPPDGETLETGSRSYLIRRRPIAWAEKKALLVTVTDITICRRQEQALRREVGRLSYQSRHDALTGALNRFEYQRRAAAAVTGILGVAFCDVNSLKAINDAHGHTEGDSALVQAARILRECFPGGELFRMGGDEFLVLCTDVPRPRFEEMAGQARRRLADETAHGAALGHVWSAGEGIFLQALVQQADAAMYTEKPAHHKTAERSPHGAL